VVQIDRGLLQAGWILAVGLVSVASVACSSGDSSPPAPGTDSGTTMDGQVTPGVDAGAGDGASNGDVVVTDAGGPCNILFDFNGMNNTPPPGLTLTSAQVADWAPETYCIGQTPEAGIAADAGTCTNATYTFLQGVSTAAADPTVGDPNACGNAGSLMLSIPFSGFSQQALFQYQFPTPTDLTPYGKTLYVRVRADSGFNPSASVPGGFILAVKTGSTFLYGSSGYKNVTAPATGGWQEFTVSLIPAPSDAPTDAGANFDPTMVEAIELHFDTGGGAGGDAGAAAGTTPLPAVFHVDTIGIR
jgi:hypothetical protein